MKILQHLSHHFQSGAMAGIFIDVFVNNSLKAVHFVRNVTLDIIH